MGKAENWEKCSKWEKCGMCLAPFGYTFYKFIIETVIVIIYIIKNPSGAARGAL